MAVIHWFNPFSEWLYKLDLIIFNIDSLENKSGSEQYLYNNKKHRKLMATKSWLDLNKTTAKQVPTQNMPPAS